MWQRHRFQPCRDIVIREAEIAMPSLLMQTEQAAIEQALEVRTGGRGADTCNTRQFAGRTRRAIHQRKQNCRPGWLRQQGAQLGKLITIKRTDFGHGHSLAIMCGQRFVSGRSFFGGTF